MRKLLWPLTLVSLLSLTLFSFGLRHDHLDVGKSRQLSLVAEDIVALSTSKTLGQEVLQLAAQPSVDAWAGPSYRGENYQMLKAARSSSVALLSFKPERYGADGQIMVRAAGGAIVLETIRQNPDWAAGTDRPEYFTSFQTLYTGHFRWWLWIPLAGLLWLLGGGALIGRFIYQRRQSPIDAAQPGVRSRLSPFAERSEA